MKRFTVLLLTAVMLTLSGCGGEDDFVDVAVVQVPEEEQGPLDRLEDWWYDIWYTFFADPEEKEAIESYERENGPIS